VISAGDHDLAEKLNGGYGAWNQEKQDWFISPTINLMASGNGPGNYNDQGIDQEVADATNDIRVRFDIYPHGFDLVNSGGGIRVAWASYPVLQPNGPKTWGVKKLTSFSSYTFTFGCFSFASPSGANGKLNALIQTTNANGVPDSVRALIERLSVCFRNTASVVVCGPDQSDPAGGGYIDNLAVGFVDGAARGAAVAAAVGHPSGRVPVEQQRRAGRHGELRHLRGKGEERPQHLLTHRNDRPLSPGHTGRFDDRERARVEYPHGSRVSHLPGRRQLHDRGEPGLGPASAPGRSRCAGDRG
jgi:hypothetical protein